MSRLQKLLIEAICVSSIHAMLNARIMEQPSIQSGFEELETKLDVFYMIGNQILLTFYIESPS